MFPSSLPAMGAESSFFCVRGAVMRRIVLLTLGILLLAIGVRMASPSHAAAASSGKIIYSFAGGGDGAYPESDLILDAA